MSWEVEFKTKWGCTEVRHPLIDELEREVGEVTVSIRLCPCRVAVVTYRTVDGEEVGRECFPLTEAEVSRGGSFYSLMSKYLSAAVKSVTKTDNLTEAIDPVLFKDRPAIQEFMTLLRDDDGKPRETSCLMIAMRSQGMAVGLKDESAGWFWREGKSLAACLNAIEKALQEGTAAFGGSGGNRGGKGRQKSS